MMPRMGTVLPISHPLGLSLSWRMFPSLCCPCTKGWLLLQGWPCSVKWDRAGRTTGGEQGWGPCPAVWAVSGQSFFFQPQNLPSLSAFGRDPWVTLPGTLVATLGWDDPPVPGLGLTQR